MSLDVVDLSSFENGSGAEKQTIAASLVQALRREGFVYLRGLPIAEDKVDKMFEWSKAFFSLPLDIKMQAPHPESGAHHRGYSSVGREKVIQEVVGKSETEARRAAASDVKESFEFGLTGKDVEQPNILIPDSELPGFNSYLEEFYAACCSVADLILRVVAVGLNAPENFFEEYHSEHDHQLRLLHYPPVDISALNAGTKERLGAHTDYDTLTFLFQDSNGGLEVEQHDSPGAGSGNGTFRPVKPLGKMTAVLNTGDFLARWSNDLLKSTVHRVFTPPGSDSNGKTSDRYSIPFFVAPNRSLKIHTIRSCIGEHDKYPEASTIYEYIQSRAAKNY